jgi:thiosulfate dehydrogenase
MKKTVLLAVLCLFVAVTMLSGQEAKKKAEMGDADKELMAAVERGKALFGDPALGTSGMSCNSCHMEGGTKPGTMGDMKTKPFMNVAASYPKYVGMAKKVITLDQIVNICIMGPLKGEPLKWDDQRLADLSAYIASVKAGKAGTME